MIREDFHSEKKKKIKSKKMEKFLGLGGSQTSAQNPNSNTSQGGTKPPPAGQSLADKINFGGKNPPPPPPPVKPSK